MEQRDISSTNSVQPVGLLGLRFFLNSNSTNQWHWTFESFTGCPIQRTMPGWGGKQVSSQLRRQPQLVHHHSPHPRQRLSAALRRLLGADLLDQRQRSTEKPQALWIYHQGKQRQRNGRGNVVVYGRRRGTDNNLQSFEQRQRAVRHQE